MAASKQAPAEADPAAIAATDQLQGDHDIGLEKEVVTMGELQLEKDFAHGELSVRVLGEPQIPADVVASGNQRQRAWSSSRRVLE